MPRNSAVLQRKRRTATARRLLALAAIYDGATRTEAAKIGGVGLQIIRGWVIRFNAPRRDGLLDRKSPGQPSKLNATQRQAIARMAYLLAMTWATSASVGMRFSISRSGASACRRKGRGLTEALTALSRRRYCCPV